MDAQIINIKRISHRKIKIEYLINIITEDGTLVIKKDEYLKIGYEYHESKDKFTTYGLSRMNNPIRNLSRKYSIKMTNIKFSWKQENIDIPDFGEYTLNIPVNIQFKWEKDKIRDEKIKRILE